MEWAMEWAKGVAIDDGECLSDTGLITAGIVLRSVTLIGIAGIRR